MIRGFDPRLPEWEYLHGLVLDRSTLRAILGRVWGFLWRYVCAVVLVTGWAVIEEYLGLPDAIGGIQGSRVPVSPSFFLVFLALTSAVEVLAVVAALSIVPSNPGRWRLRSGECCFARSHRRGSSGSGFLWLRAQRCFASIRPEQNPVCLAVAPTIVIPMMLGVLFAPVCHVGAHLCPQHLAPSVPPTGRSSECLLDLTQEMGTIQEHTREPENAALWGT